jgi:hypothetical protein
MERRIDWDKYQRLKRNADKILQLDYEDFVRLLVEDYGVERDSEVFNAAVRIWKELRGVSC